MADPGSDLPRELQANAWIGDEPRAAWATLSPGVTAWLLRNAPPAVRTFLKPEEPADPRDWRDERVGWGLVLPHKAGLPETALASADDAPEPIRQLVADRAAPVFRYRSDWSHRFRFLRDYRQSKDVAVSGSAPGTEPGHLPRYLLIYGTPEQVPWELQYVLNGSCAVGRLDLEGAALENYVSALRRDWAGASAQPADSITWSVDHGGNDITALMHDVVARPVHDKLAADTQIAGRARLLDGARATGAELRAALESARPGLVVTTSHGMTGPLGDRKAMRQLLGAPVDQGFQPIRPEDLLRSWQPAGAIWYAHACCSAGCDSRTIFKGVVTDGSEIDRTLDAIASLGAMTAPLPRALLGAAQPLRAFVGHVEPTFDWTLRDPVNGEVQTDSLQRALYDQLYRPAPVGHALRETYARLAPLFTAYDVSQRAFNEGQNTRGAMLTSLLTARDIQSLVILGDPTATLPPLP